MRSRRRSPRQLTKAELRAMGVSPGLMAHRVGPDGRSRLEQLTSEGASARAFLARRLTNNNEATMDTNTSEGEACPPYTQ